MNVCAFPSRQAPSRRRNARYERWRWQIFAITWLAYVGFYLTRKAFWVAKVGIGENSSIGLTLDQMGWIEFGYGLVYSIGQFIFGMSGDLFGSRKVVLIGLFLSALACFAMGLSSTPIAFGLLCGLQGLCQSTGWAPLSKNVINFFTRRERGGMMGLWCTNYAVGGFIASIYAGWIGLQFGFRYALFAKAVTLLGIFGLFYLFLQFLKKPAVGRFFRNQWIDRATHCGTPLVGSFACQSSQSSTGADQAQCFIDNVRPMVAPTNNSRTDPQLHAIGCIHHLFLFLRFAAFGRFLRNCTLIQRNGPDDVGLESIAKYHGEEEAVLDKDETAEEELGYSWKVIAEVLSNKMLLLLAIAYFFLKPTRSAIFAWNPVFLPAIKLALGSCLFFIGFFLYAPDSLVSSSAVVDFGTEKGASTAVAVINGCGSVGSLLGLALPAFVVSRWGWHAGLWILGNFILIAGILPTPQWNALPKMT